MAGCSGGQADKAGGSSGPIVLRVGTPNAADRPESGGLEYFAARVAKLSHGQVEVEIVWEAAGGPEQPVAAMVRDGRLDGALVAARAWDMEGVTSLKALQTPFLIDSQALENRVVASPLAARMLAGLEKDDVVGLALLPAQLLHPFGFGRALRSPHDFAGSRIRVPVSTTSYGLVRALGGKPVSPNGDAFNLGVRNGAVDGAEWYLELGNTLPVGDGPSTATGNVVFYPKVHSLVVNSAAFAKLGAGQQAAVRKAAGEALRYTVRTNMSEATAAAQFCRGGGAIVASSPAEVASLRRAAAPVAAALARDTLTRNLIAGIRKLDAQVPAVLPVTLCQPPSAAAVPAPESRTGPRIPDGTYRKNLTERELIDAGVSRTDAHNNYGLQTLTITGYRWRWVTRSSVKLPAGVTPYCSGPISYAGSRVTFIADCSSATSTILLRGTWRLDGRDLRFPGLTGIFDRVFWGGRPWRKID